MADNMITCPQCRTAIPLSEALSHQFEEKAKRDYEQKAERQRAEILAKEKALAEREAQLLEERRKAEAESARKLALERERIEKEAVRRFEEQNAVEKRDMQLRLQEQQRKIEESQRAELELRKRQRELEDKEREMALRMQREMDQLRKQIEEQTFARASQEYRQKMLEAEKEKADMLKTIDDLRRKAEQGSQQTQGEVVELELETQLRAQFPTDNIEPVAKGIRGADVVQRVIRNGKSCGTIIWESKQTKLWSEGWIDKLKEDQRQAKADVAVLLTAALPKGCSTFTQINGVWVTCQACLPSLAATLRWAMVQHTMARSLAEGADAKMKALYAYLSGPEFRQRVEAIHDASRAMHDQLERERRLYQKNWSEREKLIGRVADSLLSMHGDLQGLGATLEHIHSIDGDAEEIESSSAASLPHLPKAPAKASQAPAGASRAPLDLPDEDDQLF
jgi:hypothetical protein